MNGQNTKTNDRRQLKSGSYILVVTVVLLAVIITLNVLVAALPTQNTELDISEKQLYTIGDTTKGVVDKLTEKVEMFYIVEEGNEDKNVAQMLSSYASLSSNITLKNVDPAVDPKFASEYIAEEVKSGSVIFHSEKRSTVVSSSDMYRYSVEGYGEMSYDELNEMYMEFYYGGYSQYGYQFPDYTQLFYGEQAFTSAIDYVTTDELPKLCAVAGHGETELDDTYKDYVSTENYALEELSLLTSDIPDDAEALLLNKPTSDLTEEEADKLASYVKGGGDLIVVTACDIYTEAELPNLAALLAEFGMKAEEGLVLEYDSSHVPSQMPQYFFYPQFGENTEDSPVSKLDSTNLGILFAYAHGIVSTDAENVTFTDILHTSDDAKIQKANEDAQTDSVETTDETTDEATEQTEPVTVDGKATVAASAKYDGGGRVIWYASEAISDATYDVVRGNSALFVATLNFTSGKTESISIIGKDMNVETFTTDETTRTLWTIVLCVVVPVAILGAGLGVWVYRRRR